MSIKLMETRREDASVATMVRRRAAEVRLA
jgi:hypothetical protein